MTSKEYNKILKCIGYRGNDIIVPEINQTELVSIIGMMMKKIQELESEVERLKYYSPNEDLDE